MEKQNHNGSDIYFPLYFNFLNPESGWFSPYDLGHYHSANSFKLLESKYFDIKHGDYLEYLRGYSVNAC